MKNYIINLIVGNQVKIGAKIPTEKELQKIFNISRQPVREALKELFYTDWIYPKQGSGYYVSAHGNYDVLFMKGKYKAAETLIRDLKKEEKSILEKYKFRSFASKNKFFVKEYYDENKELLIKTINIINKDYLLGISTNEIKMGTIQALIFKNVNITHQVNEIDFFHFQKRFLGWNKSMPIIKSSLHENDKIIEKTIIFIKKKIFSFRKITIF